MKVLITGINGFIAQSLIEKLDQSIYEIYGLDIQKETSCQVKNYFCIDLSKRFYLEEKFDIVLHLAALNRTNVDVDFEYDLFHKVNVLGTRNIALGCNYKKFIFMSSTSVYDRDVDIITEESKVNPISKYAKSKWEAENILTECISHEKLVIVRAANVIGIKQKDIAVIPIFFKKALHNEEIHIFVPPNRTIQLLDIGDLVSAITLIFENKINGVFNLAPKNSIEIKDLAIRIITRCNSKSLIRITNDHSECRAFICSNRIEQAINWKAKRTIPKILDDYYYKRKAMNISSNERNRDGNLGKK